MPLQTISLRPGVDLQKTQTLAEGTWWQSNLIRFFNGLVQKLGGWTHLTTTPLVGTARGMAAWADLDGNDYIAIGTEQRLELFYAGLLSDITPIRATSNISPNFSTVLNSTSVTVTDPANGAEAGDWVDIIVPVSVGGIIIQGLYLVQSIVDSNNYTITVATPATSGVSNAGDVPSFTTIMGSPNVTVTLDNNGQTSSSLFTVQVATTVATIVMTAYSTYSVISITNANQFVIAPGGNASVSTTAFENSGNARIQYLISSGFASNTALTGWGVGPWGGGPWGGGTGSVIVPLRQWFLGNWGEQLIGNYTGSTIYIWIPPPEPGNVAVAITGTDVPQTVNVSFVAMPEQILIVLGSDPVGGGTLDPNLVRWSDVADYTDWLPTTANQAGSFRIPTGSRIVGGLQGQQFGYIWTDIDFWLMSYLGTPFVFGFNKVASGCDLLAARAAGIFQSIVVWASANNFFIYDGNSVNVIPCTVWDFFYDNLDRAQKDKVFCAVNSWFAEATWYFPSATGTGEVDSYVKYNIRENLWDCGSLIRTTWVDDNVFGAPIGVDGNGILQQHETSVDADGQAMNPMVTSGFLSISDGTYLSTVKRVIPDFKYGGSNETVPWYVIVQDYPTDPTTTFGPFYATSSGPEYQSILGRGRVAAIQVGGLPVLGNFWRMGAFKMLIQPSGRR